MQGVLLMLLALGDPQILQNLDCLWCMCVHRTLRVRKPALVELASFGAYDTFQLYNVVLAAWRVLVQSTHV